MNLATFTLIVTVVLFLLGQLLINITYLSKLNTRITRVETHLVHLLKMYQAKLSKHMNRPPHDHGDAPP